jgi:nitrogen fixation-related uncharacterized protein
MDLLERIAILFIFVPISILFALFLAVIVVLFVTESKKQPSPPEENEQL